MGNRLLGALILMIVGKSGGKTHEIFIGFYYEFVGIFRFEIR
jgi:hypothetical protein